MKISAIQDVIYLYSTCELCVPLLLLIRKYMFLYTKQNDFSIVSILKVKVGLSGINHMAFFPSLLKGEAKCV